MTETPDKPNADKVVNLRSAQPFTGVGEPVPEIVEACKGLLLRAEAGELCGLAVAYLVRDGSDISIIGYRYNLHSGKGFAPILDSAIGCLHRDFERWIDSA